MAEFKVLSAAEVEEKFGYTDAQLEAMEADAAAGRFHGEPDGEPVFGRPLKFGEPMRQVGFKEPLTKVQAIDRRAAQLGMRRSEYLRYLVDADLALATA